MKYRGSIDIDKPYTEVAKLFADPSKLKKWQDGFQKKELLNGQIGKEGAISKIFYKDSKRNIELIETILKNILPDSFEAFYHHKHMDNSMKCIFVPLEANKTRYTYEIEYTRISWIIPKLMAIIFPSIYRKQAEKWMKQFKEFAEAQV